MRPASHASLPGFSPCGPRGLSGHRSDPHQAGPAPHRVQAPLLILQELGVWVRGVD